MIWALIEKIPLIHCISVQVNYWFYFADKVDGNGSELLDLQDIIDLHQSLSFLRFVKRSRARNTLCNVSLFHQETQQLLEDRAPLPLIHQGIFTQSGELVYLGSLCQKASESSIHQHLYIQFYPHRSVVCRP